MVDHRLLCRDKTMLRITIPARDSIELWDEKNQRFLSKPPIKETTLQLEHSLVSVSKWEQKWHKPFLSDKSKTDEEVKDYVRCMTLTQNVDPAVYDYLTSENYNDIDAYIENPMTATWFSDSCVKVSSVSWSRRSKLHDSLSATTR